MTDTTALLERIRAAMQDRNVNQQRLADAIGVSESVMSRLMRGSRKITAAELGAIADALGVSSGQLLGKVTPDVRPFAMAARIGTTAHDRTLDPVFARARTLLELRGVLGRLVEAPTRPPRVQVDRPNTWSFKLAGEKMAERVRDALDLGAAPITDLQSVVERAFGVDVAIEPLPQALHGVFLTDPGPLLSDAGKLSLMLVNSRDTYGRQRYTLAHEVAHLLFDDAELFWADYRKTGKDNREKRADYFAAAFLAPKAGVMDVADSLGPAPTDEHARHVWLTRFVCEVSLRFGLSVEASIYRCDNLNLLDVPDKEYLMGRSASALLDDAGRSDERNELDGLQDVVAPPLELRDQALFAYSEGMIGIELLVQLWHSEDPEGLRVQLADAGWAPPYA